MQAWSDGASNEGFAFFGVDADGWTFHSSEFGTVSLRPYMTIAYDPPQPASLDLDANNDSGATGSSHALTFTENDAAVLVADDDATITDSDSTHFDSITVTITKQLDGAFENLSANTSGTSITASYNSGTGTLTLSGSDTVSNYQQVLRTVSYQNTSEDPNSTSRVISVQVSDAAIDSNLAYATIDILAVNDASVESSIEGMALAYTENDWAVAISSTLAIADLDDTHIESAVVQITAGYNSGEDVLSFTNQNNITGSYNSSTGAWTLTGSATLAQYETAIRSIRYTNISENPDTTTRTVSFTVNDGDDNSNTVTRDITIGSVNDDPTNAGSLSSDITVTEDVSSNIDLSAIDLSDVDASSGSLTIKLPSYDNMP